MRLREGLKGTFTFISSQLHILIFDNEHVLCLFRTISGKFSFKQTISDALQSGHIRFFPYFANPNALTEY